MIFASPLFTIGPVAFIFIMLSSSVNPATVLLSVLFLSGSVLWFYYLWTIRNQFCAWGQFEKDALRVKVLFQKPFWIPYENCMGCGIACYRHSLLNKKDTPLGSIQAYIFLSLEPFPEKYRYNINMWKPSKTRVKVQFSEKLYQYLLGTLPSKQARSLKNDYQRFALYSREGTSPGPASKK